MKKIIALLLALALTLFAVAAFAASPSKKGEDYIIVIVDPEHPGAPDGPAFYFAISDDEELVAKANAELENLKAAESVQAYFSQEDAIAKILGKAEYQVNEFWPVIAGNYDPSMGKVIVKLYFATPYKANSDVAVMLGFGEAGSVEWTTFAGKVQDDGCVQVTLDPDTVLRVQEQTALLAIVNK